MKHFKKNLENLTEILDQSLWFNENIKIQNKYIFLKTWNNLGIHKIRDMFNQYGILYTHDELTITNTILKQTI
jgi:hypothetical protein